MSVLSSWTPQKPGGNTEAKGRKWVWEGREAALHTATLVTRALPHKRTVTENKSELKKIFHFILNKKQNRQNSCKF